MLDDRDRQVSVCQGKKMRKRCCIIGYKATGSRLTEGQQHHSGASIEAEQRIYEWFSLGIFLLQHDRSSESRGISPSFGQDDTRATSVF